MYKNFILEFIRAKGQEGNGSAERLHAKVGDRMLLPPCLFPVIYHWVSPPWGTLLLLVPCRSCVRERHLLLLLILLARTTRKEQKQRALSSLPTSVTQIRRAIVSVGTAVCNLSRLSGITGWRPVDSGLHCSPCISLFRTEGWNLDF